MSDFNDHLTEDLQAFIEKQYIFFVATAPLSGEGRVNLSPKGMDSFRILDKNKVAYMDMTGSGNETSAHIAENGRITFMFCAFEDAPNIVRLYGAGQTILPDTAEWEALVDKFTLHIGTRQIIVADIDLVQSSCGYAVPFFDYQGERETLVKYWNAKGEDYVPEYQGRKNIASIDGIPTPIGQASDSSL